MLEVQAVLFQDCHYTVRQLEAIRNCTDYGKHLVVYNTVILLL